MIKTIKFLVAMALWLSLTTGISHAHPNDEIKLLCEAHIGTTVRFYNKATTFIQGKVLKCSDQAWYVEHRTNKAYVIPYQSGITSFSKEILNLE